MLLLPPSQPGAAAVAESGRGFFARWNDLILENAQDLATLIGWENGKASFDANGEVQFAASFLEWFSEEAAHIHGDVVPHSSTSFRVSVLKEPVGVAGLIVPYVLYLVSCCRGMSSDGDILLLDGTFPLA
jgi:acyl-CoA reductase-like NAD-dependent aldehyde dehydrogenase